MPKLSVVIPYYEIDSGKREVLKRCIDSIKGQYDELILVWNQGAGFVPAVNKGYELASGDFIALVCDDVILKKGSLRDLCDEKALVSAHVEGSPVQDFWGTLWCEPKWVYEKRGPMDEEYAKGLYFDDNMLFEMCTRHVQAYTNLDVVIEHPEGGRTLERITEDRKQKIEHNRELFIKQFGHMPYVTNENTAKKFGGRANR